MSAESHDLCGVRVLQCRADGPLVQTGRDALDLIGQAAEHRASLIALSTGRLSDDFFHLKTRLAGEILQKFVTYGFHIVLVGDVSRYQNESAAFRDFVIECNRGNQIWFVADSDELAQRLKAVTEQG